MNDELIYKWKLIETLKNWLDDQEHETLYGQGYDDAVKDIISLVEYEQPIRRKTEDLKSVQRKNGQWVKSRIPKSILCECNICGYDCGAYSMNYCPNCGAKMEVEENED